MMQWTPISKPPEEGQLILVRLRPDTSDVKITVFHSRLVLTVFHSGLLQYNPEFYGTVGWMPAEPILNAPMAMTPSLATTGYASADTLITAISTRMRRWLRWAANIATPSPRVWTIVKRLSQLRNRPAAPVWS